MKVIFMGSLVVMALSASIHCNKEDHAAKNIVVLIDLSSSRDSVIRKWYQAVVTSAIFSNLGRRDRITIVPVDRFSLNASKEIASIDFSQHTYGNQYNGLQGDDMEEKQHQDSLNAASTRLDASFAIAIGERSNFQKGTDIFNALQGTKRYFISNERNIVVLLCDMQQYTDKDSMNFEWYLNSTKEVDAYLQKCPPVNLAGADIIVLTGRTTEISAQKFAALQSFWTEYFKRCNARLIDYSSEAISLLETTLRTNQ